MDGHLEGLTHSRLLTACLKDAKARGGGWTPLVRDTNLFVLLLPWSPKQPNCTQTELEAREEQMVRSLKEERAEGHSEVLVQQLI